MKVIVSGIQWMAFIIAGSIVAPIAIADVFGLSPVETSGFVQRTIFVLGLCSLLQGILGHRLPIYEGPAGLWWGVFAIYAGLSTALFSSETETLQALEGAMIASGLVFFLLSIFNLINKLVQLFTPVVLGTYLLLIAFQLSGSFLNGMLGVGYRHEGVDLTITIFSILLVIFTYYLSNHKRKWMNQYSVLISLAVGWVCFYLMGLAKPVQVPSDRVIQFPKLFVFGEPIFDSGLIITAVFITLLLITNMIASIQLVNEVIGNRKTEDEKSNHMFRRAGFISGINQILGGVFSAIGSVPISGTAGFIATTKIKSIVPFIIGSVLVILSSLSSHLMGLFAALPTPVGYSVVFVVFVNMISLAFSEFAHEKDTNRIRTVIGISLLSGVGVMFVPADAFNSLPPAVSSILSNGLVFGSIVAIICDQITKRFSYKQRNRR